MCFWLIMRADKVKPGGVNGMYDRVQIMRNAHEMRKTAIKIAAGKKTMNLVTKKWEHLSVPDFGEFLKESWAQARDVDKRRYDV